MNRSIVVIVLLFTFSCQKELDLPELNDSLVVVNAIFTPSEKMKVHVSLTSSFATEEQTNLPDVIVTILKNNIKKDTLYSLSEGWYELNDQPNTGDTYKVEVTYKNQVTWGETTIPEKTRIISNELIKTRNSMVREGVTYRIWEFQTHFLNDKLNENYYEFYLSNIDNDVSMPWDFSNVTSPILINEGLLDYSPNTLVFSDDLLINDTVILTYQEAGNFDPFTYNTYEEKITLNTLSKEYYLFQKSWTIHSYNQQNEDNIDDPISMLFHGEPLELYSNIQNGLGIVGSYNQDKQLVVLRP